MMGVGFLKAAVPLYVRFSSFFLDSLTLCLVRRRREKRKVKRKKGKRRNRVPSSQEQKTEKLAIDGREVGRKG